MAYDSLKALIRQYIKTNGEQEITGQILQNVLVEMVNQYPSTDGYATQSWVTSQGYLIPGSRISLLGNDVGYLTSADLSGYATTSQLAGYLPLTGGTLTGDLNMAYSSKLNFGTAYIQQSTIPGPQGTNMGHILNFDGVDGYGYYNFDNSVHATSFVNVGGTSAQFLKADGSVDSNAYITASALTGYATQSWVTTQLASYNPTANFKTINNQSIIGTGNINIEGGGGSLYDAEIEYLESTGTQCINTGISGGSNAEYSITVALLNGNTYYEHICGSVRNAQGAPKIYVDVDPAMNSVAAEWFTTAAQRVKLFNKTDTSIHTVEYKGGKIYLDGVQKASIGTYGFGSLNFCIFNYLAEELPGTKMRLYSASVSLGGNLVRDFIPVRVGNVGYMYDKVSGQLFGNSGTGDFVLGQDTGPGGGLPYLPLTGGTITGNLTINSGRSGTGLYIYGESNQGRGRMWIDGDGFNFECSHGVLYFLTDAYFSGNIDTDGRMGVGTSASQTYQLTVNGQVGATGFVNTSDLRKKTIMGDVPMNLYNVANAPLFKFTWNNETKYSGQHIGSAAQYWQTILPELVSIGRDAEQTLAMQYDVIALASAITVAKTVVNHEERIILLERENEALKKEIADLKSA
jgi:hypothetical protein